MVSLYVGLDRLVERVLSEVRPQLSAEQARKAVFTARADILRPIVQPEWFHEALMSFDGPHSMQNVAFMHLLWEFRPFGEGADYVDEKYLEKALAVWTKYCVLPLREGTKTCQLKQRTKPDGSIERRWVLTVEATQLYLGDLLWQGRLQALS